MASQLCTCLLSQLFLCLTPLSHFLWAPREVRCWAQIVVGIYGPSAAPLPTLLVGRGSMTHFLLGKYFYRKHLSNVRRGGERSEISQLFLSCPPGQRLWDFFCTFTPSLSSISSSLTWLSQRRGAQIRERPTSLPPFLINGVSIRPGPLMKLSASLDPSRRKADKELSITPHILDSEPIPTSWSREPATQTWFFPGWGRLVKQDHWLRGLSWVFRLLPPTTSAEEKSPPSRCLRFPHSVHAAIFSFMRSCMKQSDLNLSSAG